MTEVDERELRRFRPLDHRQCAFARAIGEGHSKKEAQIAAGYLPNRKNANLLMQNPRVVARWSACGIWSKALDMRRCSSSSIRSDPNET